MAKLEYTSNEQFYPLVKRITDGILSGSLSATLEDESDFSDGDAKCAVRVFERYSYFGKNRVSMSVVFFQNGGGPVRASAITSGGSQAVFIKINTLGEEAFLSKLRELL